MMFCYLNLNIDPKIYDVFVILLLFQVFFNEGSGRLECEDGGDPGTTTKYL